MSMPSWSSSLELGVPNMDAAHRALFDTLAHVARLAPGDFAHHCRALFDALELDCKEEEALMEEIHFPGLQAHREQHARVLGGLHHALAALDAGDPAPARRALELLPRWLELHIATMDSALAMAVALAQPAQVELGA
ncbi:bacteriohemerythrin [Massilia sp. TS11]|uniref:bacteriohemerythrin n=1 Tax=Massilia sp. TS11 TaxID=2908003 RepID=UPI001EDC6C17|nr:hemerythrin family protein [Massilia sp. TS11]MCG2583980.1 hemerythrin family protein [Massilia sp. TS11]